MRQETRRPRAEHALVHRALRVKAGAPDLLLFQHSQHRHHAVEVVVMHPVQFGARITQADDHAAEFLPAQGHMAAAARDERREHQPADAARLQHVREPPPRHAARPDLELLQVIPVQPRPFQRPFEKPPRPGRGRLFHFFRPHKSQRRRSRRAPAAPHVRHQLRNFRVRPPMHLRRRRAHPLPHLVRHMPLPAQSARDGHLRHSGLFGNLA